MYYPTHLCLSQTQALKSHTSNYIELPLLDTATSISEALETLHEAGTASNPQHDMYICSRGSFVCTSSAGRATDFEGGSRTVLPTSAFHKHWLSEGIPASWDFRIHQTHSDAVLQMPPDVQLLGTSNNTHVEVIAQGGAALVLSRSQHDKGPPAQIIWATCT